MFWLIVAVIFVVLSFLDNGTNGWLMFIAGLICYLIFKIDTKHHTDSPTEENPHA